MDTKDIPAVFSTLDEAYKPMVIEDEELQRIMEQVEVDRKSSFVFHSGNEFPSLSGLVSGQVSFPQFLSMIAFKMNLTDTVEELHEAFRMFDRSNSGYIK